MKIVKITKESKYIFVVEFKPNIIQRLFGIKNKTQRFKQEPYQRYYYGEGGIYYAENGEELGVFSKVGKAIDTFRHSWS